MVHFDIVLLNQKQSNETNSSDNSIFNRFASHFESKEPESMKKLELEQNSDSINTRN